MITVFCVLVVHTAEASRIEGRELFRLKWNYNQV